MFYVGAGTPGRLGVVDATECPPTFGTPPELVQPIMAGGHEAVFASMEKAEDDAEAGAHALHERKLTENDVVVGLSASGRTPFVLGALQFARERGALTVGVTTHEGAALREDSDFFVAPVTGPEAVTGSTRLKAGTSQKMVLNLISTGVMLRLGYIEGNLMVRVQPWCDKLVVRSQGLVMRLTGADEASAREALDKNSGDVQAAVQWLKERSNHHEFTNGNCTD